MYGVDAHISAGLGASAQTHSEFSNESFLF